MQLLHAAQLGIFVITKNRLSRARYSFAYTPLLHEAKGTGHAKKKHRGCIREGLPALKHRDLGEQIRHPRDINIRAIGSGQ